MRIQNLHSVLARSTHTHTRIHTEREYSSQQKNNNKFLHAHIFSNYYYRFGASYWTDFEDGILCETWNATKGATLDGGEKWKKKNHSLQKSSQTVTNKTPRSGSYLFSWNAHWSAYHISSNLVVFKKCLRRRQLVFSWFFLDDFIVLCASLSLPYAHTRTFRNHVACSFLCWILFLPYLRFMHKIHLFINVLWRQYGSVQATIYAVVFFLSPLDLLCLICVHWWVMILVLTFAEEPFLGMYSKLNRWQNQAIIQHKYIDLKRPRGAKKKNALCTWNSIRTARRRSAFDELKSTETRKYWFAMKDIHCRGYLR